MGGELSPMGPGNRRCSSLCLFSFLLILVGSALAPIVHGRNTAGEERTGGGDWGGSQILVQ